MTSKGWVLCVKTVPDAENTPPSTDGARHWEITAAPGTGLNSIAVEMTSYVLLALLSGPVLDGFGLGYSSSIVRWLVKQQDRNGGFSSTQVGMLSFHLDFFTLDLADALIQSDLQ